MIQLVNKEDIRSKGRYTKFKRCSKCRSKNINPALTENAMTNGRTQKFYLCDKCDTNNNEPLVETTE